jgi:hypothetical protein
LSCDQLWIGSESTSDVAYRFRLYFDFRTPELTADPPIHELGKVVRTLARSQ